VSAVGEQGRELLIKRGPHLAVVPNGPTEAFLRRTGTRIRGFAKGTSGSLYNLASRYHDWDPAVMAAIAMAESGGRTHAHNYNLGTGDDSYGLWQINMLGSMGPARRAEFGIRTNAALYNPGTNVLAAHDIWRGSGYGAWSTYNSGAYLQFMGSHPTYTGGGSGSGSGSPKPGSPQYRHNHRVAMRNQLHQGAATFRSQQHPNRIIQAGGQYWVNGQSYGSLAVAQQALAQQQAQNRINALGNIPGDLAGFAHSLGSVSGERSAFAQLLGDVRGAGAPAHLIEHLRDLNARLDAEIRKTARDVNTLHTDVAKLRAARQAARQERATITSAVRGSFDITSAGVNPVTGVVTAGSLEAAAKQEAAIIHKWGRDLRKLSREGFGKSPAGRMMLRQLFESGPSSLPQVEALASESQGELKQLLNTVGGIDRMGASLGLFESRRLYGQRIHQDERLVRRDRARVRADRRHERELMKEIVREAIREIKHLDVRIDPRGVARVVLTGEKLLQQTGHRVKK